MKRFLDRLPTPLVPGWRFGYFLLACYSWVVPLYFALGVYPPGVLPNADALLRVPGATLGSLLAALVLAAGFTWGMAGTRTGLAALRIVGAALATLGLGAGLRELFLADALQGQAWAFMLPAFAFLAWTAADVQRGTRMFSRLRAACDCGMAWLESRVGLGRLAALAAVLWSAELVLAATNRYYRMVALADTARYDQALFHTLHGQPGYEAIDGITHLAVHFTPSLAVLLPIYAVAPGSFTLLVLQSLLLGLAAWPLWFLALRLTGSRTAAFAITLVYLFYPHVQGLNIDGFREICLWPVVGFAYLLVLEQGQPARRPVFWLLLLLALGVKEELPVTVAALSLVFVIQGRDRALHLAVIVIAAVWFLGVTKGLMPWLLGPAGHPEKGTGWLFADHFEDFLPEGHRTFSAYLLNAALNPLLLLHQALRPVALWFLFMVGAPLLFLPLLGGWTLLGLVANLVLTNLVSHDLTVLSSHNRVIAYLVPLFYCGLYGSKRAAAWLGRRRAAGAGWTDGGVMPYLALLVSVLLLTQQAQGVHAIPPERTVVRRYLEGLPRELKLVVPKCFSPMVSTRDVVRWVSATTRFDDVDLVMGESHGTLCRGVNFDFPLLERAVLDSGRFVREDGPIPSVAVYRRKAP